MEAEARRVQREKIAEATPYRGRNEAEAMPEGVWKEALAGACGAGDSAGLGVQVGSA